MDSPTNISRVSIVHVHEPISSFREPLTAMIALLVFPSIDVRHINRKISCFRIMVGEYWHLRPTHGPITHLADEPELESSKWGTFGVPSGYTNKQGSTSPARVSSITA
ncbi:hypothetical protein VTL71DRAFT_12903 [Oculimacula yallundae]|uniref:Uncharacterized protein n=1 Tax=Oculimacula yallundae TaxID=86028 RepID=A0ABR4CPK4_9HELO